MTIKFSKKFYSLTAVKKSIKAYQSLAGFKITERKKTIEVLIENIDKDFKNVLVDEFSNYVLSEMKNAY